MVDFLRGALVTGQMGHGLDDAGVLVLACAAATAAAHYLYPRVIM